MTAAPARAYGLALLAGLAPALLLASSCVALRFRFAPELGTPLWWHLYDPLAVVRWAWSWGLAPGYRDDFLRGLSLAVVPLLLPAAALRLREMRAPPEPDERPAGSRLGTAADLRRLGTFSRRRPASSSGSTAGGRCSRPATCTPWSWGRRAPARASTTSSRRCLTWTDSALVLDFKGELASIAGPMRAHLGKVYTIDATSPRSARFNPLLSVRTGPEMVTDAPGAGAHAGSPGSRRAGGRHDLERCHRAHGDGAAHRRAPLAGAHARALLPPAGRPPGEATVACRHAWAAEMLHRVWNAWPDKTRGSVLFNLDTRLAFLASELVQAVVSGHDFARRGPDGGRPAGHRLRRHAARHGGRRCCRCTGCCSPRSCGR